VRNVDKNHPQIHPERRFSKSSSFITNIYTFSIP
jgi:hypothetical protein